MLLNITKWSILTETSGSFSLELCRKEQKMVSFRTYAFVDQSKHAVNNIFCNYVCVVWTMRLYVNSSFNRRVEVCLIIDQMNHVLIWWKWFDERYIFLSSVFCILASMCRRVAVCTHAGAACMFASWSSLAKGLQNCFAPCCMEYILQILKNQLQS